MRREYLKRLTSGKRGQRIQAWSELHLQPEARHYLLSRADRRILAKILPEESDEGVYRFAVSTLLGFSSKVKNAPKLDVSSELAPAKESRSLDRWLWWAFRKPSAVYEILDPDCGLRDPNASHHLARRLSYHEFPNTDFRQITFAEDNGWQQLREGGSFDTVCLIGRLGLYDTDAVEKLRCKEARFEFPLQSRPAGLPRGALHDEYHVIREYVSGSDVKKLEDYFTEDDAEVRTDYGLVQRYMAYVGTRWITVVVCAGASYLGTWGAAQWAARDLSLAQDPSTNAPIPAPKQISPRSRMEALVKITADTGQPRWNLSNIELCKLIVDDVVWAPEELGWKQEPPREIKLVLKDDVPDSIWVDGVCEQFNGRKENQGFRLATAMLWDIVQQKGAVPLSALIENKTIWKDAAVTKTQVKKSLHDLNRRHLRDAIIIGDEVRMKSDVVVERA